MIVLGIDPGYAIVGWGAVEYRGNRFFTLGHGAVQTPANTDFSSRLECIYNELNDVCRTYRPDFAAVERLYFTTNQKTAIAVAEARGVIILSLRQNGIPLFEYTPLQVKQAVVGYGKADKKQVIEMTRHILGIEMPRLDDTADALAIAICHAHSFNSHINKYLR
ncbi:MAG: crossover junction endodeoxyribonuclease RuvC [Clostridia bacterium]|nr:crossover junction endodeoxyribonuclease RuvC [Clostridia bacterium]